MGLDTSKKINRVTVNGIDMTVVGVPSLQDKTITENGSYTYDEPFDGLKTVEVDVQPDLITKTITENGTYMASDDGADGYSAVSVNIESKVTEPSGVELNVAGTWTTNADGSANTETGVYYNFTHDGKVQVIALGNVTDLGTYIIDGNVINITGDAGNQTWYYNEDGGIAVEENAESMMWRLVPSGTLEVKENGDYDVTPNTKVNVNVAGGGGLDINGNLKQCEASEALEAGDFVKIQDSVDVTQDIIFGSASYIPTIQKLSDNKFFVAGYSSKGIILKIDDNFTHTQVAYTPSIPVSSSYSPHVSIRYDDTKFLVFAAYGYSTKEAIYGAVVEVVDDTITVLQRTQLTTKGYTWSPGTYSVERVSENQFIVAGSYSNQRQATGYLVEVNPEDYSMTEVKKAVTSPYSSCSNYIAIYENNILYVDGKLGNSWQVHLNNSNSILKTYYSPQSYSVIHKLVRLDDDNIAMFYTWGNGSSPATSPTRCEVYNISSNTITEPVQVSDSALSSMPIKVADNKVQFLSVIGASNVRLTTVTFNGSQVDEVEHKEFSIAPNKFYSYTTTSNPTVVFAELENLNSVLIYAYMDNSKYCKVLLGVPVATKITSASDTLAGVAKDSGNASDIVEVFVPNV